MFKIGLDLGYGYVKGINEENRKVVFPSLVGMGYKRSLSGLFDRNKSDIQNNMHVVVGGNDGQKEYFVGELARREGRNVSYAFDEHKVNHPNTKALIAAASGFLLPEEDVDVHIVTGLPLEQFMHQKEEFKDMLKNYNLIVEFRGYGKVKIVKFDRVTVFPQAAGAVYYSIMNDLSKYLVKGSYIGLVDIGFRTTDYIVFYISEKLSLREDLSGTVDIGMSELNNTADRLFTGKTGTKLDIPELLQLVQQGSIFYRGKEMNLKDELDTVKYELARTIKDRIKSVWGSKLDFFNTVFLAGGGVKALSGHMTDIYENTVTVKDAQFANARGFLKVAEIEDRGGE